jgi:hypothetical protein
MQFLRERKTEVLQKRGVGEFSGKKISKCWTKSLSAADPEQVKCEERG